MKLRFALFLSFVPLVCFAGGPLEVRSDALIYVWDLSGGPIHYRVDGGPMAATATTTVIDHTAGVNRVDAMFAAWQAVPTASLQFQNDGSLQSTGAFGGFGCRKKAIA